MDFDSTTCWEYIDHICGIFREENAEIYVVELVASQEVRLQRNVMKSRLLAKASKRNTEWTTKMIYETDSTKRCVSNDGEMPFEKYIKIDNTNLAPDVVAKTIKEKFSL